MKYEDRELLDRVVHYYHGRVFEDETVRGYLQKVGLAHQETCINFKLGYAGGLMTALPEDTETFGKLKRLGILTDDLNETLNDCLVVPIRSEGKTFSNIMGIGLQDGRERFLPGNEMLFNIEALKSSREIFLTDSVLNALLLYSIGLREVTAVIGDTINHTHLKLFERYQIKALTLLVEKHNLQRYSKKIKSQGIAVGYVDIEAKSLSRLILEGLKKDYCLTLGKEPSIDITEPVIEERGEEIFYEFEDRRYRVRRLDPFRLDSLRVNLKATHQGLWHLDTIDLYSERQRTNFIKQAKKLIRIEQGFLYQDILKITDDLEDRQSKIILEKKEKDREMSASEKEEALKFLKSDDITADILRDFLFLGVVGEENNILLGYLSIISRKLNHTLSLLLFGRDSSCKELLKDGLLEIIPDEDVERFTKISPQVLFYRDELSLQNKVLVIDDERSLKELEYILINLQGKGLSYSVTHKSPETGKLRSHDYRVKGPVSIFVSLSNPKAVKRLLNHFILLKTDESPEQIHKILEKQREDDTLDGILQAKRREIIKRKHQNAQRLLKPYTVVNPYANDIDSGNVVSSNPSVQEKYLTLVKAVCFLRQYHKDVRRMEETGEEYIEVDLIDIEIARHLMDTVWKGQSPLTDTTEAALTEIKDLVIEKSGIEKRPEGDITFTRKELGSYLGLRDSKVRAAIEELMSARYIELVSGTNGKTMEYRLVSGKRLDLVKPCETASQGQKNTTFGKSKRYENAR